MSTNNLLPFVFDNIPVRGKILHLRGMEKFVPSLTQNNETINKCLSELLTAASVLTHDLKNEANVTLQVQSPSKVGLMVSHCEHDGTLKAYANTSDLADNEEISYKDISGEGSLFALTVKQAESGQSYQSFVALDKVSVSSSIESYFTQSFQKETYFKVFTEEKDGVVNCSALFLQMLPDEDSTKYEDDWHRLGLILGTLHKEEVFNASLKKEDLLLRLFAEDKIRVFERQELKLDQHGTKNRMQEALVKLGVKTCKELLEEGPIEMVCEFSGKKYTFDAVDVATLFGSDWAKD